MKENPDMIFKIFGNQVSFSEYESKEEFSPLVIDVCKERHLGNFGRKKEKLLFEDSELWKKVVSGEESGFQLTIKAI
jgi:hypothetical protein